MRRQLALLASLGTALALEWNRGGLDQQRMSSNGASKAQELASLLDSSPVGVKSDGMRYYTDLPAEQINKSYSKELLNNLDTLKDQYVIRFTNWGSGRARDAIIISAHELQLDIWAHSKTHGFVDIQCTKQQAAQLLEVIEAAVPFESFDVNLMVADLPQAIFETLQEARVGYFEDDDDDDDNDDDGDDDGDGDDDDDDPEPVPVEPPLTDREFFNGYQRLETIYNWFDDLVDRYPDLLEVEWIGQTYEGRDIKALRISAHKKKGKHIKTVVLTGGVHAREWISISTVCYILSRMLSDAELGSRKAKEYMDNFDFLYLPVMNPDGYEYSWTSERLWRKNRQQTYNPRCFGIDIDHSFNYHFTKTTDTPCSEEYSGEGAFEALESYAWDSYLNDTKHQHPIYAYIDLHSYAEEVQYPYAYSCTQLPRDEENLLELAYGFSQAIRLTSGKVYGVLSACEGRGADLLPEYGAGSELDYMYHNKAYWAFVLKLRDTGTRGFLLPPTAIPPVGEEIYSALKYMCDFLLNPDN